MRITITTTLDISAQNEPLVPIVAESIGFTGGDVDEFIKEKLSAMNKASLIALVEPSVVSYFGRVMADTARAVSEQLQTAVQSTVEITREEVGS